MLAAALSVAAGYYIAGGRDLSAAVLPVVLTAVITGAGNVINDCYDVAIDRINKPRRPLPSRRLTRRGALVLYAVLSCIVLVGCAFVRPVGLAWIFAAWHVALFAYAARLKRVLFAGNLLVAVVSGSAFVAGAVAGGNVAVSVVPALLAFGFVLGREVVKGCEDVEGDREAGVHTLAVVFGTTRAARVGTVLMLGLALLLPVPTLTGLYGTGYLWIMLALVVPLLVAGSWMILRRPQRRAYTRVSWLLKAGMFFGILAIVVG